MANAAINILGDGAIYDFCTVNGRTDQVFVRRQDIGVYNVFGTKGMVPAPDGWGAVTNPVDNITAQVAYDGSVLTLETQNIDGQPVDIGSKVTLHILVEDAPPAVLHSEPEPVPALKIESSFATLKAQADSRLQLLQDLLDVGEGTPEIEASALEWKRYRVALSRTVEQPGYPLDVQWPPLPDEGR
jgi:hypothetical protein